MPGFTRYVPKSLNIDKMASCSAAIGNDDDNLHSMGGKMLPLIPGMTSADAEYEGLLMGLDKLRVYLSEEQNMNNFVSNPVLTVKGDCKVIVDQFQGKSAPRKMEMKYNLAMEKIRRIQKMCLAQLTTNDKKLSVRFQHIPRDENHLCDAICRLLVNQKQRSSVASIYELIKLGKEEAPIQSSRPMKKKTKKKAVTKNIHFQKALDGIISSTELDLQLCHSSQLALACELTSAAISQKDAIVLDEMADFFLLMSRRWGRIYYYEDTNSWEIKNSLADLSMKCKEMSDYYMTRAGQEDDDAANQDVVTVLQTLFEFFTNNNDMEGTNGGVESPFMDVSELVDEIDNDGWKEVQQWDLLASDAIRRDVTTLESGVWLSPKVVAQS
jgi:ribonuclease HI